MRSCQKALIAFLYLVHLGSRVRRPSSANSTRGRDLIHRFFHRRIAERKPILQQMNAQQGFSESLLHLYAKNIQMTTLREC